MGTEVERTGMSDDNQTIALDGVGEVRLPVVELLTGRGFITGKAGSGKSNSASVIAEELLSDGFPLLIVDTDGEYYGLKEEYEMLHVGADEECDLQVGPEHGEKLAELALEQNVPIILDVSGFLDAEDANELIRATAQSLFGKAKKQKQPFLVLVEEIHEYIPEGGGLDGVGQILVKIGKRGRKHGLGIVGISQRPADVKKDFITQCDWLLWHRLTWENDTKVVRSVVDAETADAVADLADGEGFLMADWDDADIRRVQVRRKHTFDAGATPDLGEFERPELKSVSDDLVGELEEISAQQERRRDRIATLEARIDELQAEKEELEEELQNARDMSDMAEQFTQAMLQQGNGGDVTSEQVEELIEERNALQKRLEQHENRVDELESELAAAREKLQQRPDIGERAVEAVEVLAEEFGVGEADESKWKRKYRQAQERIEELEDEQSRPNPEPDERENPKVRRYISEMQDRADDLGEKQLAMLWYYMLDGPDSSKEAYKYAGGSPTSSAAGKKNRELIDAGFVTEIKHGSYDYGLPDHAADQLGDHFDQETVQFAVRQVEDYIEQQYESEVAA